MTALIAFLTFLAPGLMARTLSWLFLVLFVLLLTGNNQ